MPPRIWFSEKQEMSAVSGNFLGSVCGKKISIKHLPSGRSSGIFLTGERIGRFELEGSLILVEIPDRGVQIFQVDNDEFNAKIEVGAGGLGVSCILHDGRIFVASDFGIRGEVWSLGSEKPEIIKSIENAKGAGQGVSGCDILRKSPLNWKIGEPAYFSVSENLTLFAVLSRADNRDYIEIIDNRDMRTLNKFEVDSQDAAGVTFVHGNSLLIWEKCMECRVFVYSLEGEIIAKRDIYQNKLGIKSLSIGRGMIAIGCFDGSIRLFLSDLTELTEFKHLNLFNVPTSQMIILREKIQGVKHPELHLLGAQGLTGKVIYDCEKKNCGEQVFLPGGVGGIGIVVFSNSGRYLATRAEDQPTAVIIWDLAVLGIIAVCLHRQAVRSIVWQNSGEDVLAIATGDPRIFFYDSSGIVREPIDLSGEFEALGILQFKNDRVVVQGRETVCVVDLTYSVSGG